MEAPVRILFNPPFTLLNKPANQMVLNKPIRPVSTLSLSSISHHHLRHHRAHSLSPLSPFSHFLNSLSLSSPNSLTPSTHSFSSSSRNDAVFGWNRARERPLISGGGDGDPVTTVVLLGWLGSQRKHLKKYVEWYNARGVHAVTFVVGVRELFRIDLGETVLRKTASLAEDLVSWVSERESDGRPRCLLFHTFSNTGYLA